VERASEPLSAPAKIDAGDLLESIKWPLESGRFALDPLAPRAYKPDLSLFAALIGVYTTLQRVFKSCHRVAGECFQRPIFHLMCSKLGNL